MKNIGSNAVDFLNKLKIGKMMKIVYKNKWVLLSLVLLVLFYYFFYSMKSFKEGNEDIAAGTDTAENNVDGEYLKIPETIATEQKGKGAYDRSVNVKIKTSEQNIQNKQNDTVALKDDINIAINGIKTNLQSIIDRDKAIANKIPNEE
tara:strand:- start:2510 stop:2953 length:444 start_codon:yes stop_codon:yes gene_type:complete